MLRSADSPHLTPTDAELLHLFLSSRDDAAFGRLVARHGEPVRRVATRATGNPSAAEDVAQAAFIVMARRPRAAWVSACCRGSALPWLVRTTRYAASTWRRTEARRRRHESAAAASERVDPSRPGELTEAVAAALSRMSRGERRLITLRHLDEKPWPDVAQQVGMTPEAARKATARALARLRERLCSNGVTVTPAVLAIALSTLARPSHAAICLATTTSAFQIARGVLTMMKFQTAGLAGTAILAAVMSVGVIGGGFGSTSPTLATPGADPSLQDRAQGNQEEREITQRQSGQADEARPARFEPNEHQPSVTLADGTKLTLLAISNTEDGWWHADGTRAREPKHYLPAGLGNSSSTATSDEVDSLLEMAFFAESPEAAGHGLGLARVLIGPEAAEPTLIATGMNSKDGRAAWRIMASNQPGETSEARLCITTGKPEKVGEVRRSADGSWSLDEGAAPWVVLGMEDSTLFLEGAKAEESAAISVVGVTDGERHHGEIRQNRLAFSQEALRGVDRLEVYRRGLEVVKLANMARQPEQQTRPTMEVAAEPTVLMTASDAMVHVGAGSHSHTTVRTGGTGHGHAEAGGQGGVTVTGSGGATATAGGGGTANTRSSGAAAGAGGAAGGNQGGDPDDE